ncbi:MAG: MaoC family dehydratase [Pseudomonadota bacterium]
MEFVDPDTVKDWIGKETGVSKWFLIDQNRINQFADVTEDFQFIHVDPEQAKLTPFGGTIAHGFLTMALLSPMTIGSVLMFKGMKMALNYGFEKVRFLTPVASGKRVRGRFTLKSVQRQPSGQMRVEYVVRVEIEGEEKPALIAEWISMVIL